jgi:diguanylate cyclase (GGDEF)-like protein
VRTKVLNGNSHASVEAQVGAQLRSSGTAHYLTQPQSDHALTDEAGSRHTSVSRRQQLAAAQRQIDKLLKLNTLIKEESALLAESLANARRFAYHDALTGLPNRRLLLDHFNGAVARAKRQHNQVALLFLDLDNFKGINDALGHSAADKLLQQVASRLKACIRGSDTACRYGGDELVVLLPDIERRDQAVAATEKIRTQLAALYVIDGTKVRITVSIGMATWPIDGEDCDELLRAADFAMYRDKGRSTTAQQVHEAALEASGHRANGNGSTKERGRTNGRTNGQSAQTRSRANVDRATE